MFFSFYDQYMTMAEVDTTVSESVGNTTVDSTLSVIDHIVLLIENHGISVVLISIIAILLVTSAIFIMSISKRALNKVIDDNKASNEATEVNIEQIVKTTLQAAIETMAETTQSTTEKTLTEAINKEKESHKEVISIHINASKAFRSACKEALHKLNCNRVAIYLLHNGNSTPYGYPFAKFSCVHEFTDRGGSSTLRGRNHNGAPLYAFSDMIEGLLENGEYVVENTSNLIFDEDSELDGFLCGAPIHSLYAVAIHDHNDMIAAFSIAEFRERQDFTNNKNNLVKETLLDLNRSVKNIIIADEFIEGYNSNM